MDELFLITQPAHLQKQVSDKLSAEERDLIRADMVRDRLKNVNRPVVKPTGSPVARPTETRDLIYWPAPYGLRQAGIFSRAIQFAKPLQDGGRRFFSWMQKNRGVVCINQQFMPGGNVWMASSSVCQRQKRGPESL